MAFVQIMEVRTKRIAEVEALEAEYEAATEGKRTVKRSVLTRDRNDPDRYLVLVHFDSYEEAMRNSQLPETQELAGKLVSLLDAPPVFHDLDVVDERM